MYLSRMSYMSYNFHPNKFAFVIPLYIRKVTSEHGDGKRRQRTALCLHSVLPCLRFYLYHSSSSGHGWGYCIFFSSFRALIKNGIWMAASTSNTIPLNLPTSPLAT